MKKILSGILVLCIFILTGCNNDRIDKAQTSVYTASVLQSDDNEIGGSTMSWDEHEPTEQELKTQEVLDKSTDEDLNKIINHSYSQNDLIDFISYMSGPNDVIMLYQLDEKFPIECIRIFNDSLTYCVYNLKEGGFLFVYLFNDLEFVHYIFLVKKTLIKDDFSKLEKGSPLRDVEKIDPGIKIINSMGKLPLTHEVTYHMVKEGFIKIIYNSDNFDPETYKVESVEFIPNGQSIIDFYNLGDSSAYNYKFLEQDYPD